MTPTDAARRGDNADENRAYDAAKPNTNSASDARRSHASAISNSDPRGTKNHHKEATDIAGRRRALLDKIALFERRGAILPADAHTLRFQVHDSTSGQWAAVEQRMQQLAFNWNPYQDYSADERRAQDQQQSSPTKNTQANPQKATTGSNSEVSQQKTVKQKKKKKKKDFYELLELSGNDARAEEIKLQFRKLALRLHPDKQQQSTSKNDKDAVKNAEETAVDVPDSTEFSRLRLAYETLRDPEQRAAYDVKLQEMESGVTAQDAFVKGVDVKNQIALEASTDYASLEWMARVKHKMDVMDRIAEWAKLLHIRATDLRFEAGEPCIGKGCGKIVSMDRDLECYGSPRRRVYVCLLHKYVHACDESCTSHMGDTEYDRKVCTIRAYWLVQNWIFDTLQQQQIIQAHRAQQRDGDDEESKESEHPVHPNTENSEQELVASEIYLGDALTTFSLAKVHECVSRGCSNNFVYLEDGIFVCRRHGTPHVCTFEQCDRKELRDGKYVCWVSRKLYGFKREAVGTGVRTRRVVYSDNNGESSAIDMEVPVMLPLGKMTSFLLEGAPKAAVDRSSSLSPPPPAAKVWGYDDDEEQQDNGETVGSPSSQPPRRATTVASYKRAREEEISPTRARIRRRLNEKVEQSDPSFYVYLHVPQAVANLPRVALELQEQMPVVGDDGEPVVNNILPIRVQPRHTLNYIKHWMEELTEQLISIWDQQFFWGDTLIGNEGRVMTLDEHGIKDGTQLELRLHDDCPLLVGDWAGKQTVAGEYNTVQISKEAEEDLDEQEEEHENVIAVEEEAFQRERFDRKRERMEQRGAIHHMEVIEFHGDVPKLVGVVAEKHHKRPKLLGGSRKGEDAKPKKLEAQLAVDKHDVAMRKEAAFAVAVKRES